VVIRAGRVLCRLAKSKKRNNPKGTAANVDTCSYASFLSKQT
jgi:hypothetical protein